MSAARQRRVDLHDAARSVVLRDVTNIDADAVGLANTLYASASVHIPGYGFSWRHMASPARRQRLVLGSPDAAGDSTPSLEIDLAGDILGLPPAELTWNRLSGALRLAAWTIEHEPVLELLGAAFGRDLVLRSIESRVNGPGETAAHSGVGFRICRDDAVEVTRGVVRIPGEYATQLLERSRPELPNTLWRDCTVHARCVIDSFAITASQLRELVPDSIVLIDNLTLAAARPQLIITLGANRWLAHAEGSRLVVVARADQRQTPFLNDRETGSMEAEPDTSNTPPDTAEAPKPQDTGPEEAIDTGEIPIVLRFEAGQLTLPFRDVETIRPGHVFELDKPLDRHAVTVYANDRPIASGELVAVGKRLGVRMTSAPRPVVVTAATLGED